MVLSNLNLKIKNLETRFGEIPAGRKALLTDLSNYITAKIKNNEPAKLIFICTHNSRRSHMSQIWAQTSAEYFGIPNIYCFSGGTESTEFNPNAVKAIKDFGFLVIKKADSENPIFLIRFAEDKLPLECFSKVYDDDFNPQSDFAAIMTCSDADENCPTVFGADSRFSISYDDPKEYDGTELESEKYKERFEEIGIELLFLFAKVKKLLVT